MIARGEGDMEELISLRIVRLFGQLDEADETWVQDHLTTRRFASGEVILAEGAANHALHVVAGGRIRVARAVGAHEVPLTDLVRGDTFGEMSLLEDGVASATLTAVAPSIVLSIAAADLSAFLEANPVAASRFWRALAVELRRRLLNTNDLVRSYFEMNQALIENPTFRKAYALCNG